MKIVLQIELQPGKVESFDDVVTTLQHTAGLLSDPSEKLAGSVEVGIFTVTSDPINDFTNQLA